MTLEYLVTKEQNMYHVGIFIDTRCLQKKPFRTLNGAAEYILRDTYHDGVVNNYYVVPYMNQPLQDRFWKVYDRMKNNRKRTGKLR